MGFGTAEVCGWQRLAASGVVGDSGKAVDILGYTIAGGGTLTQPYFINGTAATGTVAWRDTPRAVSLESSQALAFPIRLASGCYVSFDANTTFVTVFYRQMLT